MGQSVDFVLPSNVTVENINQVADELMTMLRQAVPANGKSFTLDAASTLVITTPGVQLLVGLSKSLEAAGGKLVVKNAGTPFRQSFRELGVSQSFIEGESQI